MRQIPFGKYCQSNSSTNVKIKILDDNDIRENFVKMFSNAKDESDNCAITPDAMTSLLMCAYHVSMDHYSEGPQMCLSINKTLKAVVDSCFHGKQQLSVTYAAHWMEHNVPRLLFPLHRYIVHVLATSWRTLDVDEQGTTLAAGKSIYFTSKIN